jgi:hypothetical protein
LCSAAAVARSLILAGGSVSAADVLGLYYRVADGPDAGASIWEMLAAAYRYGIGGVKPLWFEPSPVVVLDGATGPGGLGFFEPEQCEPHPAPLAFLPPATQITPGAAAELPPLPVGWLGAVPLGVVASAHGTKRSSVILGVDLPGDHAVVADSGQWWSWGTAWPLSAFPAAQVFEAWAVAW